MVERIRAAGDDPAEYVEISFKVPERTQSKGLGFALAGNFYPDFLLWLVGDAVGKQSLIFIDPKGIRNMNLFDPKFGLFQEFKEIEKQLADPALALNAFVLSVTPFIDLLNVVRHDDKVGN